MKKIFCTALALLLCLSLCLILAPGAFAEGTETAYDSEVIVGFDTSDFSDTIDLDHKYSLVELQKMFPAQLAVYFGGTVTYAPDENGVRSISRVEGYIKQYLNVEWACLEDYDQEFKVFHFVPVLGDYALAAELALPVIRVNILGELEIPSLVDMPSAVSPTLSLSDNAVFDSSEDPGIPYYNGFELGNLPTVRAQGIYGACWAFSTITCLEADMIHDGVVDTGIDLSELHLAHYVYHDYYDEKGCNQGDTVELGTSEYLDLGGNPHSAGLTLANLVGPVPESVAPYSDAYSHSFVYEQAKSSNAAQLTGMYIFDPHNVNATKNAILAHGAVSTSVRIYDSSQEPRKYYSASSNSFYYPTTGVNTNHAVTLVGWDDNFSKNNFLRGTPEGDGAWLVRNSWGVNSNDFGGYFWMSYYDKSLKSEAYAFDAQPWQYQHCYAYDNSPGISYYDSIPAGLDIAQQFHVDGGEQIEAIGFYNGSPNVQVDFTVTCGSNSVSASRTFDDVGYYLVPLSEPLMVDTPSDVTASFVCTCDGNPIIHIERSLTSLYEDQSLAYSYTATCGSGMMIPYYDYQAGADLRLKLFTNDTGVSGVAINETNFPDSVFRAYVSANCDTDGNGYLSDSEIQDVTTIDVSYSGTVNTEKIGSLKGVEHFVNLLFLDCAGNALTELDVSQNTQLGGLICGIMDNNGNVFGNQLSSLSLSNNTQLEYLYCTHNQISSLDVSSNTALAALYCYNNGMTQLNISGCTSLATLSCGNNQLTSLDVSGNTALANLYCYNNNLRTLTVKNHPSLAFLQCSANPLLGTLDVSGCTKLANLYCQNCGLSILNVNGCTQLKQVGCANNSLSTLDFSTCANLRDLGCQDNSLVSLNLTGCGLLSGLGCSDNQLNTLDLSTCVNLVGLTCNGNPMTSVDLTSCPALVRLMCTAEHTETDGLVSYTDDNGMITCDSTLSLLVTSLLELPANLTVIEDEAFAGGSFVYVVVPEGTVSVGPHAFANCPNLAYIFVQSADTAIDPSAFEGSNNVTVITPAA